MTDNIKTTVQEKSAWAKVPQEFNDWWNGDYSDESNPFRLNSAAYWAWAGWSEAVRLNAQAQRQLTDEKEALDLLNAENARLMKLVIELRAEVVRLNAQAVPDEWEREIWRKKLENLISEYGGERATEAYHGGHFCKRNPTAIRKEISAMLSAAPAAPQPAQAVPDTQEKDLLQAIQERDAAEDYIDALLDEVLGTDRPEWSSVYGHADAIEQVRERMNTLMKPSIDKAWDRFQSSVAPAAPQPAQPLDLGVMELAESVGLIGPASRTDDLHEAIQRFHDLIVVNASIKAARHFADGLAQQPLTDEQCDAIYTALDAWARKADAYEFGLPRAYGDGAKGGREIIRNAISGVKND